MPITELGLISKPIEDRLKINKLPVESPDGSITDFTLPDGDAYVPGTLTVYIDGLKFRKANITELSYTTFRTSIAPDSDEVLEITYIKR